MLLAVLGAAAGAAIGAWWKDYGARESIAWGLYGAGALVLAFAVAPFLGGGDGGAMPSPEADRAHVQWRTSLMGDLSTLLQLLLIGSVLIGLGLLVDFVV